MPFQGQQAAKQSCSVHARSSSHCVVHGRRKSIFLTLQWQRKPGMSSMPGQHNGKQPHR